MVPRRWIARLALVVLLPAALQADTLILRDGSRVQGELLGIRNGQIEFEERRGFGAGRTVRFDRDEVDRIEFENRRFSNNSNNNSNRQQQQFVQRPAVRHAREADDRLRRRRLERHGH